MKFKKLIPLVIAAWVAVNSQTARAQYTTFTFQGQLNDGGAPANGNYEIQFSVYNAATGGNSLSVTPPVIAAAIVNGAFTAPVDVQSLGDNTRSIQDNSHSLLDNWLQVSVRPAGGGSFTPLLPRQKVYALPISAFAQESAHAALADQVAAGAVTHAQIAPGAIHADSISSGAAVLSVNGLTDNVTLAAGSGITLQSANGTITIAAAGGGAGGGWALGGNAGTVAGQFIGTTDNQPLEIKVFGRRALRFEPSSYPSVAPNLIGGSEVNAVGAGFIADLIGGGQYNSLNSSFAVIGGGESNMGGTNSDWSFLGAGFDNLLGDNSGGSVLAGGENNVITNSLQGVIAGGVQNTLGQADASFIGGGINNSVLPDSNGIAASRATIGGGGANKIIAGYGNTIGGGENSSITGSSDSTVAGGDLNGVYQSLGGTIAGGIFNSNLAAFGGTIGGGQNNTVGDGHINAGYATIPGGAFNTALGEYSFAAGLYAQATNTGAFVWSDSLAYQNDPFTSALNNEFAVRARGGVRLVTGGAGLTVDGLPVLTSGSATIPANQSVTAAKLSAPNPAAGEILAVGPDGTSLVWTTPPTGNATGAWLLGGNNGANGQFLGTTANYPLELRTDNQRVVIYGTLKNPAGQIGVNIMGGQTGNFVAPGITAATISGGGIIDSDGSLHTNSIIGNYGVIAGGFDNFVGSEGGVIGGGSRNRTTDNNATVAGGLQNTAQGNSSVVGGGFNNISGGVAGLFTTISGGTFNTAYGLFGTVPGGKFNNAAGTASFAAGYRATAAHDGAFVWADDTEADFLSITTNEFAVRASGGVRFVTGGKGLTVDGVAIGSGGGTLANGSVTAAKIAASSPAAGQVLTIGSDGTSLIWTTPASVGSSGWSLTGNAGTASYNFLGTTDDEPLEMRVNGHAALRISPDVLGGVNIVGGAGLNYVGSPVASVFIGGGGAANLNGGSEPNSIGAAANYAALVGGAGNTIGGGASGAFLGGGLMNSVGLDSTAATVSGGTTNGIGNYSTASTISGGQNNSISLDTTFATVGGGANNYIGQIVNSATIAGGNANDINDHTAYGSIGGGNANLVSGDRGTVPGGDQNEAGAGSLAAGHRAKARMAGSFVWADTTETDFVATQANQFAVRAGGGAVISGGGNISAPQLNLQQTSSDFARLRLSNPVNSWDIAAGTDASLRFYTAGADHMILTTGGLQVNGSFVQTSDRNAKEKFAPVDNREILERVAALPISSWNYKQDAGTRHIGPMAQDFYAAFDVGMDDKHIATVDEEGVALAAIQGLNELVKEKDTEIKNLNQRLDAMEKLVKQLAEKQ